MTVSSTNESLGALHDILPDGKHDPRPKLRVVSDVECISGHISAADSDIASWLGLSDLRLNSDTISEHPHLRHDYRHDTLMYILPFRKQIFNVFGDRLDVQACEEHFLSKQSILPLCCAAEAEMSVGVVKKR